MKFTPTRMIKALLLAVLGGAVVILLIAATRPDSFRVERSVRVKAPPERVFALINDMRAFNEWNPFAKKDPAMKATYSGAAAGKGSAFGWEGEEAGVGSMEITDAVSPSMVAMKLDFMKPFEAHNHVAFTLRPEADGTHVTWAMDGPVPYPSKVMHMLFNVDKMIGDDFESGLLDLKTLAERRR